MAVRCFRCDRSYGTSRALDQHIRNSPNHHECPECDFDGATWDDLLDHCRDEGCRAVCQDCDDGRGANYNPQSEEYLDHLEDFNVCIECERHFTSPSHLHQHRLSHREPRVECYQCSSMFKTYGGMIIHLESGICSDINYIDLNKLAAECYEWPNFIYEDFRDELLDDGDTEYDVDPYTCPTCDTALPKLSSLFQHVESNACAQTLDDGAVGRLRSFLFDRLW